MQTLLLVEDNSMLRRALRGTLESAVADDGAPLFRVLAAGDCEEAIELAMATRPDAAIVDFVLPDDADGTPCDGVILLRKLRALWPGIPCALVSGMLPQDPRVPRAGFTEVCPKPLLGHELLALARRLTR